MPYRGAASLSSTSWIARALVTLTRDVGPGFLWDPERINARESLKLLQGKLALGLCLHRRLNLVAGMRS